MAESSNLEFYIQIAVFFIAILTVSVVYYYYYTDDTNILKTGYTYYGKDIIKDKPIFVVDALNSKECIQRCTADAKCGGITYDIQGGKGNCTGAPSNAIFRADEPRYVGWKKGSSAKLIEGKKISYVFGISNDNYVVEGNKLPPSPFINKCLFAMWLHIKDWQINYKYWKHILHKGTEPNTREYITDWTAIDSLYPEQYIGLWFKPHKNTLRIAITTEKIVASAIPKSFNDESNADEIYNIINKSPPDDAINITQRELEFYDIPNIPIRKLIHLAISIYDNYCQIYINNKLYTTQQLRGNPVHNNGNLYIKNSITFAGDVYNFAYMTQTPAIGDIAALYDDKPILIS